MYIWDIPEWVGIALTALFIGAMAYGLWCGIDSTRDHTKDATK